MTNLSNLKALYTLLKPLGSTSLKVTSVDAVGLKEYTLQYKTEGRIPFNWPIDGTADFTFVFSETDGSWKCSGSLFGMLPEAIDPKVWFSQVLSSLKLKEQLLISMLAKATAMWERYNGDLEQFAYRLSTEFASSTTMVRKDNGVFVWIKPNHADTLIAFSESREKPKYGMPPAAYFGFYEAASTHTWKMTPHNLHTIRTNISNFIVQAESFIKRATDCLDFDPQ